MELAKAPKCLYEAIKVIDKNSSDEDRRLFAKKDQKCPGVSLHFSSGMDMRNSWGLWDKDQPLTKWFRERGIWHPDDMSAIIYKAYWYHLNDMPFNILKEAMYYENYWWESGLGFDGEKLENK